MSLPQIQFGDTIVLGDLRSFPVDVGVNIFRPKDCFPKSMPIAWFVVYAVFQADGALSVMRTQINAVTAEEILNENNDLLADTAYMFIFPVSQGESINFQYSSSTTASKLLVLEIIRQP